MSGRTSWLYASQLNAEQSAAMQAGLDAMVGTGVDYEGRMFMMFAAVSSVNGIVEVDADFDGHQGSDY